jgi:hypothetical protein
MIWVRLQIFIAILFCFSVGFDYEYVIANIRGGGETLGQSSILVNNALEKATNLSIPVKLSDLLTFLLLIIFLKKSKEIIDVVISSPKKNELYWLLSTVVAYFLWSAVTILANFDAYTSSQILIMTLHLIKLLQVMLTGIMMGIILKDCDIKIISRLFLLGFIIICTTLYLNIIGWVNIGKLAGDRVETFGVIIIVFAIILKLYVIEDFTNKINYSKKILYIIFIFIGTFAIFNCGKRAVLLAFICCLPFIFFSIRCKEKFRISMLQFTMIVSVLIGMQTIPAVYQRTLGNTYDAVQGTPYQKNIYEAAEKITNLTASELKLDGVPLISNLDYSGAERVGKYIKTLSLIPENMLTGSGFWGVHYKYKFLPDSALVLILETGLIGTLIFLVMIYRTWRITSEGLANFCSVTKLSNAMIVVVAFAVLSVFSNPYYMSRLVLIWMFFTSFSLFVSTKSNQENGSMKI